MSFTLLDQGFPFSSSHKRTSYIVQSNLYSTSIFLARTSEQAWSSSSRMPTKHIIPFPILEIIFPSTVTDADSTLCRTIRMAAKKNRIEISPIASSKTVFEQTLL